MGVARDAERGRLAGRRVYGRHDDRVGPVAGVGRPEVAPEQQHGKPAVRPQQGIGTRWRRFRGWDRAGSGRGGVLGRQRGGGLTGGNDERGLLDLDVGLGIHGAGGTRRTAPPRMPKLAAPIPTTRMTGTRTAATRRPGRQVLPCVANRAHALTIPDTTGTRDRRGPAAQRPATLATICDAAP